MLALKHLLALHTSTRRAGGGNRGAAPRDIARDTARVSTSAQASCIHTRHAVRLSLAKERGSAAGRGAKKLLVATGSTRWAHSLAPCISPPPGPSEHTRRWQCWRLRCARSWSPARAHRTPSLRPRRPLRLPRRLQAPLVSAAASVRAANPLSPDMRRAWRAAGVAGGRIYLARESRTPC